MRRCVRWSAARTTWNHWRTAIDEVFQQTMKRHPGAKETSPKWISLPAFALFSSFSSCMHIELEVIPTRPLVFRYALVVCLSCHLYLLVVYTHVYTLLLIIIIRYIHFWSFNVLRPRPTCLTVGCNHAAVWYILFAFRYISNSRSSLHFIELTVTFTFYILHIDLTFSRCRPMIFFVILMDTVLFVYMLLSLCD